MVVLCAGRGGSFLLLLLLSLVPLLGRVGLLADAARVAVSSPSPVPDAPFLPDVAVPPAGERLYVRY
jgi:hypothetical protein